MKPKKAHPIATFIMSATLASIVGLGLAGIAQGVLASGAGERHEREHDKDRHDKGEYRYGSHGGVNLAPQETLAQYQQECSACHIAYPPALLPARSWQMVMSSLDDHFGEDASLDDASRQQISDYLIRNAAQADSRFMRRINDSRTPQRITELPYFVRKHHELSRAMVNDNPDVGSFSNCDSCHRDAGRGEFNEDTVNIPGFGRWND